MTNKKLNVFIKGILLHNGKMKFTLHRQTKIGGEIGMPYDGDHFDLDHVISIAKEVAASGDYGFREDWYRELQTKKLIGMTVYQGAYYAGRSIEAIKAFKNSYGLV